MDEPLDEDSLEEIALLEEELLAEDDSFELLVPLSDEERDSLEFSELEELTVLLALRFLIEHDVNAKTEVNDKNNNKRPFFIFKWRIHYNYKLFL